MILPLDRNPGRLLSFDPMKEVESEIPPNLFRGVQALPRSDRYVVYRLLNRMVSFKAPENGTKVSGFVDEVYRDIFTSEVRLTLGGRNYRFKEPVLVRELDHELVFVYGDVGRQEVSDSKLFREMRKEQFHETANDTLRRLALRRVKETRFSVGAKKPSRRKPFLMRGITADLTVPVV